MARTLLVSLTLSGILSLVQGLSLAAEMPEEVARFRLNDPLEVVIQDLESYIPDFLESNSVPGASVVLIRDNEIVWNGSFGKKNSLTNQTVGTDTLFEVASNSKVVTAYAALRLVDAQRLALDLPLSSYLSEPWLPTSEYRDVISLRQILSHSSGLGHGSTSKENIFAPGRGYSYSAIGYQYLQAVIEYVLAKPLEDVAGEVVFEPLDMTTSSFIVEEGFVSSTANGHVKALLAVTPFLLLYIIFLIPLGLVLLCTMRIRTGSWRLSRLNLTGMLLVVLIITLFSGAFLLRLANLWEFALVFTVAGLILAGVVLLTTWFGHLVLNKLRALYPRTGVLVTISLYLLIVTGLATLIVRIENVPVPSWPEISGDAAGSMRSTATDLAKFLIELSDPKFLSEEMITEMQRAQIKLSDDLSWGLGPGILHSDEGDALWQWGQHVDFQSIMLIYPGYGFGVVVCTNSDFLKPDVALDIAIRALGDSIEPVRGGIHLAHNFRESEP